MHALANSWQRANTYVTTKTWHNNEKAQEPTQAGRLHAQELCSYTKRSKWLNSAEYTSRRKDCCGQAGRKHYFQGLVYARTPLRMFRLKGPVAFLLGSITKMVKSRVARYGRSDLCRDGASPQHAFALTSACPFRVCALSQEDRLCDGWAIASHARTKRS